MIARYFRADFVWLWNANGTIAVMTKSQKNLENITHQSNAQNTAQTQRGRGHGKDAAKSKYDRPITLLEKID